MEPKRRREETKEVGEANSWLTKAAGQPNSCLTKPLVKQTTMVNFLVNQPAKVPKTTPTPEKPQKHLQEVKIVTQIV